MSTNYHQPFQRNGAPPAPSDGSVRSAAGRPRALDEVKRSKICALVAAGVSLRGAARFVGCDPVTIRREAARNPDFREELDRSRAHNELEPIRSLRAAAGTHWRAAAWWLERTQPQRFARKNPNVVTKADARGLARRLTTAIDRVVSNPEERERMHRRAAKAMPGVMRQMWDEQQAARKAEQANDCFGERENILAVERLIDQLDAEREQALGLASNP